MGESVAMGIIGGAVGVGLGFAGAALITKIAPKLSANYATPTGQHFASAGPGGPQSFTPTASHTVSVPMQASVTAGVIVLAVVLAVAGGLLAGTFGSWRIGRLRPAAALAPVEWTVQSPAWQRGRGYSGEGLMYQLTRVSKI